MAFKKSEQWTIDQILDFLDAQSVPYLVKSERFYYKDAANKAPKACIDSIEAQRTELAHAISKVQDVICGLCRGVIRDKPCHISTNASERVISCHKLCKTKLGKQWILVCSNDEFDSFAEGRDDLCFYCQKVEWARNPGAVKGMCGKCQDVIDREYEQPRSRPEPHRYQREYA